MIGHIETAIIDKLEDISKSGALGYKFRQIKSYGGELRDQQSRAKIRDFPAAWLAYDGSTLKSKTNAYDQFTARFVLLVATENLRNEKATRHGQGKDAGVYQIFQDMAGILGGFKPTGLPTASAISVDSIVPVSNESTQNGNIAVYAIALSLTYQNARISPDVDLTNPLEAIHTNWDLPPNGEVGPELPDDENADATSHLTGE